MEYHGAADDNDSLKSVLTLPPAFRDVFRFRYFNPVQSEVFNDAYMTDQNLVIAAPTGSGKTVLFELAILRLFSRYLSPSGLYEHCPGQLKVVYVAPMKALVQEKYNDWGERLGKKLGLKCQELTGDKDVSDLREMQDVDIIFTTPEKLDSISRKRNDFRGLSFFGEIALLLIDEVHLLSDPRGAALEAIVSRLKMLARYPEMKEQPIFHIRFVAVSATIPNVEDIAEWLRCSRSGLKRFGEEMRPVQLQTQVYGYSRAKNDFLFERRLQNYLLDIIKQHSKAKPSLVFCSTRKGAQDGATMLADQVASGGRGHLFIKSQEQYDRLHAAALSTADKSMQSCIRQGVAFHNGGMDFQDRSLVEGLFLRGDIMVLCTTNTLALGVNLPAHLVVIKSTQYYNKNGGGYQEYARSMLLQMAGRAGRPQFDDSGTVVIMTRNETVHLYKNLLAGSEPVESELLPSLAEHLNAEVVLLSISDISLAIDWLKNSFLFVRIKKNPEHYNINKNLSEDQLENNLKGICLKSIKQLQEYGMVTTDEDGFSLRPQEPGRLMAQYYLGLKTMQAMTRVPQSSGMEQLLLVLGQAQELSWIKLRRSEKRCLNDINSDTSGRIKYHVYTPNGKIKKVQEDGEKIFLLTNDCLSGDPSNLDFTLSQDVNGICVQGARIARCMSQLFVYEKRYKEALNALMLARSLKQRVWDGSQYELKQLAGVGMVTAKALVKAGVTTFQKLRSFDPRRLESITGRKYPFGNQMKDALEALPPEMVIQVVESEGQQHGNQLYHLTLSRGPSNSSTCKHYGHLIAGSEQDNQLLFHERIRLDQFKSPYKVTFSAKSSEFGSGQDILAAVVCEDWVGVDASAILPGGKQQTATRIPRTIQSDRDNSAPALTRNQTNTQPLSTAASSRSQGLQKSTRQPMASHGADASRPQTPCIGHQTPSVITIDDDDEDCSPNFCLLSQEDAASQEGPLETPDTTSSTQEGCKCRCRDRTMCKHVCCKKHLRWGPGDWQTWQTSLWAPEESVRSANSCRNTPNDSVFHHISKKSKGLPETSFGAAPPSSSGVDPPRSAALKPPAVPFAHREPRKRPKESQTFTPTSWPAQTQPGILKDNVQQRWRGAIAGGRTGSASSLAQSCVSDVSPMIRNEVGTTSVRQFDEERVRVPSFYVPPPSSSPSVKGFQIGRGDNRNKSQGWNGNAGLYSVQPQNTSSYPRPSKRVWPEPRMYTAQSEKDGDEECAGGSQGGCVPAEENQRNGTCGFVQSTWKPTTAYRTWQEEDTQTLPSGVQSKQPLLDASQSLFSLL